MSTMDEWNEYRAIVANLDRARKYKRNEKKTPRNALCDQLKTLDKMIEHYLAHQPHVNRIVVTFGEGDLERFATKHDNGRWEYRGFELVPLKSNHKREHIR